MWKLVLEGNAVFARAMPVVAARDPGVQAGDGVDGMRVWGVGVRMFGTTFSWRLLSTHSKGAVHVRAGGGGGVPWVLGQVLLEVWRHSSGGSGSGSGGGNTGSGRNDGSSSGSSNDQSSGGALSSCHTHTPTTTTTTSHLPCLIAASG
jgi:hypothetical protein